MPLFNGGFSFPLLSLETDRATYKNLHSALDSTLPLIIKLKSSTQSSHSVILKLRPFTTKIQFRGKITSISENVVV